MLQAGGALVVLDRRSDQVRSRERGRRGAAAATKPPLTPDQLSSYIAVNADGSVSAYFGKMDMGQASSVAIRQIVAEELDAPFDRVKIFIGDTAPASIKAAPPVRPACRTAANKCAWPQPRRGACWSKWQPTSLACRPISSTVKDGVVHADERRGEERSATPN